MVIAADDPAAEVEEGEEWLARDEEEGEVDRDFVASKGDEAEEAAVAAVEIEVDDDDETGFGGVEVREAEDVGGNGCCKPTTEDEAEKALEVDGTEGIGLSGDVAESATTVVVAVVDAPPPKPLKLVVVVVVAVEVERLALFAVETATEEEFALLFGLLEAAEETVETVEALGAVGLATPLMGREDDVVIFIIMPICDEGAANSASKVCLSTTTRQLSPLEFS